MRLVTFLAQNRIKEADREKSNATSLAHRKGEPDAIQRNS